MILTMAKFRNLYFVIIALLITNSCTSLYNKDVYQALENAGKNRIELEKVLAHYSKEPKDKLKLKAAKFLIANMHIHGSIESDQLDKFDAFFDSVGMLEVPRYCNANIRKSSHIDINKEIQLGKIYKIWNHCRDKYGVPEEFHKNYVNDLENISAELLIENIDYAFKAWEYPWAKHLTFEQFCEYVLPYRFGSEKLESWRPVFMEKYKWVLDSVKDPSDPIEICKIINRDIAGWFMFDGGFIKEYPRDFTPNQLLKFKMGYCKMQAAVATFAMRSMGLAIAHAQIFQWGNRNMGHDFSAVISKDGKFVDFLGGEHDPGKNKFGTTPAKIYNETYSIQEVPILLKDIMKTNYKDATSYYTKVSDVTINFTFPNTENSEFAYLCVFNNKDWVPVHYAKVKAGKATFKAMGCNLVYLPVYKSTNLAAGCPFILTHEGDMKILEANKSQRIHSILNRKYYWDTYWADSLMNGGRFQGANKSDFSDAEDLYVFKGLTKPIYYNELTNNNKKYKYARYLGPEGTNSTLSEIEFLDKNGIEINGKQIGTPGSYADKGNTIEKVFDKDILSYFEGATISGSWAGLKFENPSIINTIRFMGRNDGNCIEIGDEYELVYWNDNQWESLSKRKAHCDTIKYNNCPANALFLLHDLTKGKQERIFTIKDGKQIFW